MRRQVAWEELDRRGCVNEGVYLDYVGECGIQVVAAHGWPVARMSAAGFAIILRRHQIEYLAPAFLGDELEIATWVGHVRRSTAMRYYTVTRTSDQHLLARVHTYAVWLDLAAARPIRIPAHFMEDFAPNLG
jgi:acyl-CoA thioester hydrolase